MTRVGRDLLAGELFSQESEETLESSGVPAATSMGLRCPDLKTSVGVNGH